MLLFRPAPLSHEGLRQCRPAPSLKNRSDNVLGNGLPCARKHISRRTTQPLKRTHIGSNVVRAMAEKGDWKLQSQKSTDMIGGAWVGAGTKYEPRVLDLSPKTVQKEVKTHIETTKEPHFTAPIGIHRHKPLFVFLPGLDGTGPFRRATCQKLRSIVYMRKI
eukprot:9494794-Pyramimonas_sp.AAC.1